MLGVSNKPGRNDPCPCGSGKKYKRCCLPADEAAERLAQEVFSDDEPVDLDFDDLDEDDDDEFDDLDDIEPLIYVDEILCVRYTRGMVRTLSDLRAGRGLKITEWNSPDIPSAILESFEEEGLDFLEGEWGNPKVGDPIQVDIIDIESDRNVVTIQLYNRAIFLVRDDESEELQRIHRACVVLEQAASAGKNIHAE